MRIEVELKREAVPQVVLNKLYKHTPLQTTFGYNAVALVDGVPRTLSLLELSGTTSTTSARSSPAGRKFELRKAEDRAHVLEGYLIALDNIDAVIALIRAAGRHGRGAHGPHGAVRALRDPGPGDPRHAARAPHRARRKEIEDEYADLQERIAELRAILGDPARIDGVIREELLEIKEIYGRRATSAAPRSSPPRASSSSRT